jgi:hypothetical protein
MLQADNEGLLIDGASYVFTVEEGRGPTKDTSGNGDLYRNILTWLVAKGIQPTKGSTREQQAFAITNKIHKEGTQLFRRGGNSGVLSSVLNDELIARITERVADEFQAEVLTAVANAIQNK